MTHLHAFHVYLFTCTLFRINTPAGIGGNNIAGGFRWDYAVKFIVKTSLQHDKF